MESKNLVKSISAKDIEELSEKINAFSRIKHVFATQVFPKGTGYDALCYYKEEQQ